jgi:hypothetical protein
LPTLKPSSSTDRSRNQLTQSLHHKNKQQG